MASAWPTFKVRQLRNEAERGGGRQTIVRRRRRIKFYVPVYSNRC